MNFFPKETLPHRLIIEKELPVTWKGKCGAGRNELLQINIGTLLLKKSHQDPMCNTRKHTQHSVKSIGKRTPPKTCVHLCGSELVVTA